MKDVFGITVGGNVMSNGENKKRAWVRPEVRQIELNEALDLLFGHVATNASAKPHSSHRPLRSAIR